MDFIVFLVGIFLFSKYCLCYDYCEIERKYCARNKRHIVCHPEQIQRSTKIFSICPMTRKLRKLILDQHNDLRNKLSCGNLTDLNENKYPAASRMRELLWDFELEYLAQRHVERCNRTYDECHHTSLFPRTGQNLGMNPKGNVSTLTFIRNQIDLWFNEHKLGNFAIVDQYSSETETGQFTLLVNDRVNRIGCAMALCTPPNRSQVFQLLTCDYSYENLKNRPTYKQGSPQSRCQNFNVGKSPNHNCLCEPSLKSNLPEVDRRKLLQKLIENYKNKLKKFF